MGATYNEILKFKSKYKGGVAWRLPKHAEVLDTHINPDEKIIYAFPGQKNDSFFNIFSTCIVALTNRRILIAQKYVLWGYKLISITPDLFNDLEVQEELIWGRIIIDTIKEVVIVTNIDKKALPEIETSISSFMMKEKRHYAPRPEHTN